MKIAALTFAIILALLPNAASSQDASSPIKWKTIEAVEDGFSIEAPEAFRYVRDKSFNRFSEGRGEYLSDGLYLYAFVDRAKGGGQTEVVGNFVKAHRQTGNIESEGSQQITKYEFEGTDGYFHTIVMSRSETRTFAFHAVSRKPEDPSAARFISSIRFGAASNEVAETKEKEEQTTSDGDLVLDIQTATPKPGSGLGSGTGSGIGSASASGAVGSSKAQQVPSPRPEISPLKVLYKQKAQYTDFARFYNITGNVTLRVTFESDNTIGSITVIRTLPFGLTEQSIIAAKGMRFEAEIVGGQPRTTTRPVSFQFNIY